MRKHFPFVPFLAVLLLVAQFTTAATPVFIKPADFDLEKLIGPPPARGSDEEKQEIAKLLEWQNKRTDAEVARCKSEETADPFIFSEVLGDKFVANSLPITAQLLKQVQEDIRNVTTAAKEKWSRKRPPVVDERVKPCVKKEENASYPSAHAVRGVVWTRILAEIFPDKKEALLKRGLLMGEDREIAGIHFPSDVTAGQKLGDAIADKLLADPVFQTALKQAKAECQSAEISK